MTDTKSYSYATDPDIKFPSLDLIDVEALAKSVTDQWYNQTLCRVDVPLSGSALCRGNITGTSMITTTSSSSF